MSEKPQGIVETYTAFLAGRSSLDKAILASLAVFAFSCPISIGLAQAALAAALLLWLVSLSRKEAGVFPVFFLVPLAIFALLTLLTVVFSTNPQQSLWSARYLLTFAVIPPVMFGIRSGREAALIFLAMACGALLTVLWGSAEVFMGSAGGENGRRLTGFLGHYMTAGGVLMLASLSMFATALFTGRTTVRRLAIVFMILLIVGTVLTQGRNAYMGLAVGAVVLLLLRRPALIALLPFILSLLILLSPPMVRDRVFSIFDFDDASIRNRLSMASAGAGMVADFPLFGVGLQQVGTLYDRYKPEGTPGGIAHLHNNVIQIAAERGVPVSLVWLWLIGALATGHFRIFRRDDSSPWLRTASAAALAGVAGFFVSGLFEYNFGDSEVLMLFLLIVSLPHAIARSQEIHPRMPDEP